MKAYILESEREKLVIVHCPGCDIGHPFRVRSDDSKRPVWTWDGNLENPTFQPSMLVNQHHTPSRCHSFVRNGKIEFLSDCHHDLKNQTVDLPELDNDHQPIVD